MNGDPAAKNARLFLRPLYNPADYLQQLSLVCLIMFMVRTIKLMVVLGAEHLRKSLRIPHILTLFIKINRRL